MASRAAGAPDARSLDRGRALWRSRRADGNRQGHPAAARDRSGSAGARRRSCDRSGYRQRPAARDRRGDEMDGRLRRGGIRRHGAAYANSGSDHVCRPRQPRRLWRRRQARCDADRGSTGRSVRRPSLHRRARVHPAWYANQQHGRPSRRLQLRGSRARAQLPAPGSQHPDDRRQQRPACRNGTWPSVRSHPADVRPRRARPRARRPARAEHEHRVVAGWLGLLPQQHDRDRSRTHEAGSGVGTPSFHGQRAQLRTLAGAPVRRAALWPAPRDVARSLAARRHCRANAAGRLAQRHADRAPGQSLAPGRRLRGPDRQSKRSTGSRCRSRRRHAHRCAIQFVPDARHLRPPFPAAPAAIRRLDNAGWRPGADRGAVPGGPSLAPAALEDVECRLAPHGFCAAGPGR